MAMHALPPPLLVDCHMRTFDPCDTGVFDFCKVAIGDLIATLQKPSYFKVSERSFQRRFLRRRRFGSNWRKNTILKRKRLKL
jgi:hypothetical protein